MTDTDTPKKKIGSYVGAPAIFHLEMACQTLWAAFCHDAKYGGIYHVGSSLERADWRDVDIRMILDDASFAALFPRVHMEAMDYQKDPKWLVMTTAITEWLRRVSGLPVDFQFQPQSDANKRFKGTRFAIGHVFDTRPLGEENGNVQD